MSRYRSTKCGHEFDSVEKQPQCTNCLSFMVVLNPSAQDLASSTSSTKTESVQDKKDDEDEDQEDEEAINTFLDDFIKKQPRQVVVDSYYEDCPKDLTANGAVRRMNARGYRAINMSYFETSDTYEWLILFEKDE